MPRAERRTRRGHWRKPSAASVLSGVIVEHTASSNMHHAGGPAKGDELNKIEQRRVQVAEMMTSHHTYREMAERLNVASSTISDDVKAIREQWRERTVSDYGAFLAEEMAKLDQLEWKVLPQALTGDMNLRAVDRELGIRDRRARLLGLDSPSRVEVHMRVEQVAKAIELVVIEMGMDPDAVRPILGAKLRELDAISKN
jgi:hypothetical protein